MSALSSSVSSESSPFLSAFANASASIANSPGDSLPSGRPGTSPRPLSYFLSKHRAGRNDDSPAMISMTAGSAFNRSVI